MEFDKDFLGALFEQAVGSPRRRQVCDLRTSPEGAGQRALCALLPGTQMPIHRYEATAETVRFHVTGYGHGVGMSQYGANTLASEGKTWQEILHWYYTDVTIETYRPE